MQTETFYVGSIPFKSGKPFLEELFSPFGTIKEIKIVADWENPTCEPHAFVTATVQDPNQVVESLDGKKIGRLYMRVHKYVPLPKPYFASHPLTK